MKKAEREMRKAIKCLYLEAPVSVCEDIELKFNTYITEHDNEIKELIDGMIEEIDMKVNENNVTYYNGMRYALTAIKTKLGLK